MKGEETADQGDDEAVGFVSSSIDASGSADLEPYQRSSWDNKIVISNVTGTGTTADTIYDDETIYVDYGCVNSGSSDAGHFRYGLYNIDGTRVKYVDKSQDTPVTSRIRTFVSCRQARTLSKWFATTTMKSVNRTKATTSIPARLQ